jgi:hypothetical protein
MQSGYSELTVLGFIAAVLVLIPLPRQIRARNIATTVMILCFFEHCFVVGVDTIVWAGNVKDSARAWCEISEAFCDLFKHRVLTHDIRSASYIGYGVIIALPAATLCICKHLEFISSGRFVSLEKNQWRRTYFELFMCVVLPCLWMFVCMSSVFVSSSSLADHCCYCKSTAFRLHATLSLRTLDVLPRIGHHLLQLSFFSFHHWCWQ